MGNYTICVGGKEETKYRCFSANHTNLTFIALKLPLNSSAAAAPHHSLIMQGGEKF